MDIDNILNYTLTAIVTLTGQIPIISVKPTYLVYKWNKQMTFFKIYFVHTIKITILDYRQHLSFTYTTDIDNIYDTIDDALRQLQPRRLL